MLLNEVQQQHDKIAAQKKYLAAQDARIQALEQQLARLEQMNESPQAAMAKQQAKDERVAMR